MLTSLKSLLLEKSDQYARTVHIGCKAYGFCLTMTLLLPQEREFLIFFFSCHPEVSGSLGHLLKLRSISRITFKFIASIVLVSFLFSSIGYLPPGLQACPDGVHSLQQPTGSEHLLCARHHARHRANKNKTRTLILYGFVGE